MWVTGVQTCALPIWFLLQVDLFVVFAPAGRGGEGSGRLRRSTAGFLEQDLGEEKVLPGAFIDQDLVARRRATQVAFPKFRRCLPSGMEGGLPSSSPAPVSEAQRWLVCGRRRRRVRGCVGVWLYRG